MPIVFREGKSILDQISNYGMSVEPLGTIPIGMKVKVKELVVTLNRSKSTPKQMVWFIARVALAISKFVP